MAEIVHVHVHVYSNNTQTEQFILDQEAHLMVPSGAF